MSYASRCDACQRLTVDKNEEHETNRWYDITLPATAEQLENGSRYPSREEVQGCCKECAIKLIQES